MADSPNELLDLDDYGFENPFEEEIEQPKKKDIVGIDDEIKVKRTRAPAAKLDEARLLSANGIPKLKSRAKKVKFRGKGHEWSDASNLLSLYRLWLDDLYPKARFVDALAMVEKAGRKTTMIKQRTAWLDEAASRRKASIFDSVEDDDVLPLHAEPVVNNAPHSAAESPRRVARTPDAGEEFAVDRTNDLYDASPRRTQPAAAGKAPVYDHVPDFDDDDLEAMMAEAEEFDSHVPSENKPVAQSTAAPTENDYSLEDELMAEMPFDY